MQTKVISDTEVLHRSETQGVKVTREQIVEVDGKRFKCLFWTQLETGHLVQVESKPVTA